jgi:hypothetical protein
MRIATCIAPLHVHARGDGHKGVSVFIREGWQGDLDQVIGTDADGNPTTVATCLGSKLTPTNFRLEPSARKGGTANETQSQE